MVYRTSDIAETQIYALHRHLFEEILEEYPTTKKVLLMRALKRHKYLKRVSKSLDKRYRMLIKG